MKSSKISGFYRLTIAERLQLLQDFAQLTEQELELLQKQGALDLITANRMIENVVGTSQLPFGIATNFKINGKDHLVPMAVEEPSVVAAASNAAKLCRGTGGFTSKSSKPIMIGQIQLTGIKNPKKAKFAIKKNKKKILKLANSRDSTLVRLGGGAKNLEIREVKFKKKKFLVLHLLVDVKDAMGANAVNTMCETIAPLIEELTGGKSRLKILSNLCIYRTVKAKAVWPKKVLGEATINHIIEAYQLAAIDPFRAATHNKGIMNGVDAVLLATGNDWRAVEAAAHAYASFKNKGNYSSLTHYCRDKDNNLVGELEMPLAVGIVGGATGALPTAKLSLKILGVKSASQLAEIVAAVGLANNFAALRALATEGIQRGHMKLHARNIAATAGASDKLIDVVAERMIKNNKISVGEAKKILEEMK